jgi:phenylpropionate dioxygenase-like ring-hydroxylating dioxygenase large terminal subunit
MFADFANVWTPVAPASMLREHEPLAVRVADTPLVLFRDIDGQPACLVDRCPHRGVALSLGVVELGKLRCGFHGWKFDRQGAACEIPWNPDAKCERLSATSIPVRELGGQIWVYTGQKPEAEPTVDDAFLRADVRICGLVIELKTHWTRAMENMLDWPHLPFVHSKTIGRSMRSCGPGARMDIELEERAYGFRSRIRINGEEQPGALDFRFPNQMTLLIPIPRKTFVLQVACVPVGPRETRLVMMTARDFLTLPVLDFFFNRQNRKIAMEDVAVVESSMPAEIPPPAEERSVRTDEPTLWFRRSYLSLLKRSGTPAPLGGAAITDRAFPRADAPSPRPRSSVDP